MKFRDVPLNNTIVIDNIIYKCIENQSCIMCDFLHKCSKGERPNLICSQLERLDGKSVIFVKVKDMETKKFKPFDLEAAKAGEPVCTRDGRPARIICFNRVSDKYPIIALVMGRENREDVFYYDNNGKDCYNKEKDYDLVMKPKIKTGWINVHKENGLYKTEEDAINNRPNDDFVAVKVEFEI